LQDLKYVVIDKAHMYEGVFGAYVAMILARLYRVHCCCVGDKMSAAKDLRNETEKNQSQFVFLSCSATLAHPEHHFRLLCWMQSLLW
jgi:DEAD/DEAH box helicase domain-containing protein